MNLPHTEPLKPVDYVDYLSGCDIDEHLYENDLLTITGTDLNGYKFVVKHDVVNSKCHLTLLPV